MFFNERGGGGGADRAQPSDNIGIESQKIVFKKNLKNYAPCQNP